MDDTKNIIPSQTLARYESDSSDDEDDDGYATDDTSSYDLGGGGSLCIAILHGKRDPNQPTYLPGLWDSAKRPKLYHGCIVSPASSESDGQLPYRCHVQSHPLARKSENTASTSSGVIAKKESEFLVESLVDRPGLLDELYRATMPSYLGGPKPGLPTEASAIPPLLETTLEKKRSEDKKRLRDEQNIDIARREKLFPCPGAPSANPKHVLNDLNSASALHIVPSSASPTAATATFRQVLEPTEKPRLTTLSFPPFLAVHVNAAFTKLTGYPSNEILGLPLKKCLGKACHVNLPSSVTAMDGELASLKSGSNGTEKDQHKCFIKVYLVGPESADTATTALQQEDGSGAKKADQPSLCVTHYCVELDPINTGRDSERWSTITNTRRALVSPEESSTCLGVLG